MSQKAADEAVGNGTAGLQDGRTDVPATPDLDSEEIPDSFTCCVCLDLLYKPVLLSCGHMSCFWCVHKSMSSFHESQCPICRHPYIHFPSICPMLHFLLLKMYPGTYVKREKQIQEEEKKIRISSPQLDAQLWISYGNEHLTGVPEETARVDHNSFPQALTEGSQPRDLPEKEPTDCQNKVSITDVQCGSCKQLLFRPVALNCGHVFCKCCIPEAVPEKFECPLCHSLHPGDSPKVCLALDQFLEEEFSDEYASRKSAARSNDITPKIKSPKTGNDKAVKDTTRNPSGWADPFKTHYGVGCDYCGMYPIVGDRYKCQDCEEKIGFDLCGDCCNSRCMLPGRFNQQHKPEHKFKLIKLDAMRRSMTWFLTGRPPVGSSANAVLPGESAGNPVASRASDDAQEEEDDDDDDDENVEFPFHIGIAVVEDEDEESEEEESPSG
ncbi:hypothetical protein MLD38_032934 [Melastoma candidum]|uniref:Uncharacterized protein n=1 Tax=Melastoma candidum TaxID=119954 RepID=A0ACB9M7F6_9MYRT|nr:hypothetical protein MLD38_032934 [Melastoma candidum]